MTPETKKWIGVGVGAAYVILALVVLFVNTWTFLFGVASFVAGGFAYGLYLHGKLDEAVATAKEAAQKATAKVAGITRTSRIVPPKATVAEAPAVSTTAETETSVESAPAEEATTTTEA